MSNEIYKHRLPTCIAVTALVTVYHKVSLYRRMPHPEAHDFPELFYIRECSGAHHLLLDGQPYTLTKGQLMIYPPNAVHELLSESNAVVDIISFETDADLSCLFGKVITLNARQEQILTELMSAGIRLFQDAPLPEQQKGMSLHQRANAYALQKFKNELELFLIDLRLSQTALATSAISNRILSLEEQFDRLADYMMCNVNKSLSLTDLSQVFSFSVTKIQTLFYKFAGCAPMQYFLLLKLNAAKELMYTTSLNHTQIAQRLGFSSVSYFSKLFKKKIGMTPTEYVRTVQDTPSQNI